MKWTRICYQPNLPLGADGRRLTACKEHTNLAREAAKEGMVLLKNNGALLPFGFGTRLALFGKGTFDYVKGGGGSGDVTVSYVVNLYEGLKKLGSVALEESLAGFYRDYVRAQYDTGLVPGMIPEPTVPQDLLQQARAFTDTALITISRFSGEGWDRAVADANASGASQQQLALQGSRLFPKSDFYLSPEEEAMVEAVCSAFPKVAVVLNVGGMVASHWFATDHRIHSVLMAWQGGMEGGAATAQLLCGYGNPSGKLVDTFARDLEDYPSTAGFHESEDYVDYTEDIFVGYRYFETLPGAAGKVVYPFGYGLSYTTFRWNVTDVQLQEGQILVQAAVTNTGTRSGKEVLQLYVEQPQGLLGKAKRSLVAFRKTDLLEPGETQEVTISCALSDLASYDDLGKVAKSAWVLEKGVYRFWLGTSVRDVRELDFTWEAAENIVTEQLSPKLVPTSLKHRLLANGTYENLPLGVPNDPDYTALEPNDTVARFGGEMPGTRAVPRIPRRSREREERLNFRNVADGSQSLEDFVALLTDEELAHLLGGQPNTGVANTWGFGNLPQYHVPNAMTADGPAGLRIKPECGVCTTAFPCATLLACTWNTEMVYAVGQAGALEVKENNLAMWLTPAINIHRSPLCGRNFEYYSEDPMVAGSMGAALVRGIQSQNIAPCVKHFALNNKETNRKNCDSRVSERAAREIYLKAFEIIVKTAKPWGIMSSYNIINGHRASENRELLEDILRGEWGFEGMVTTDWWTYGEHYKEVLAGNDLKMASGYPERLLAAMEKGVLTRSDMEICVKRILGTLLRID